MRKELVQLSVAASLMAIALLGCSSRAPLAKPTDVIPVPTAIPTVAVLRADNPIVRAYNDLESQPVFEMTERPDLKVVNLSRIVTVFPGAISGVMDFFSELSRTEQLKGRQDFVSPLNGQSLTFTVSPARENPQRTIVILSSNVVPLPEVKKSATTYPNTFFLQEGRELLLFVNAEGNPDEDDYASIDKELFPERLDRINNSFYKALCSLKAVVQSSNQRSQEIKMLFVT